MRDQDTAAIGHDALPLKRIPQPVADFRFAKKPVEFMRADHSSELAATPYPRSDGIPCRELVESGLNERERIVFADGRIDPRQPLAQVGTVLIGERKDL